jgi:RNA polymerase sigma factor (TIGR02999 family)
MPDANAASNEVSGTTGSSGTTDALVGRFYEELRRIAVSLGQGLPAGSTLQPTALVHEAYLRLARASDLHWENRRHFFGAAARAMREILIEQHRRRGRGKRGGRLSRVPIEGVQPAIESPAENLLAVDEAITRLDRQDPRLGEVVRLRYFAGLGVEETAEVLGVSASTVKRDWRFIKAWLANELDLGTNDLRAREPEERR